MVSAHDAWADDETLAAGIQSFQGVVNFPINRMLSNWAGLRSFAPDGNLVIGPDRNNSSFFWFAGQGGYGIQTAPAAARLGAQLLLGKGRDELTRGLDLTLYCPDRFC